MNLSLPLAYSWRNMLTRRLSTTVTLLSVAAAVLVFVVMTATASGIRKVAATTGSPENVMVLSKGASSAEVSVLDRNTLHRLRELPGLARGRGGEPLVSPELLVVQTISAATVTGDADTRYVSIRGVTPTVLDVHRRVRVTAGRMPRTSGEIAIGRLVPNTLGPVGLGDELHYAGRAHHVVGVFEAGGQIFEGEVWADLDDLRSESARRGASVAVLRAESAAHVPALLARATDSRTVRVDVQSEPDYYAKIREASAAFIFLGNLIGVIMGLGAVLAGTNTMYAAMSRRVREMGTLRALGFGRTMVGSLVLLESALVAGLGGALGIALAFVFDGYALNLLGLAFELDVEAASLGQAWLLALVIGLGGGWFPARAAARLDIVQALRRV